MVSYLAFLSLTMHTLLFPFKAWLDGSSCILKADCVKCEPSHQSLTGHMIDSKEDAIAFSQLLDVSTQWKDNATLPKILLQQEALFWK